MTLKRSFPDKDLLRFLSSFGGVSIDGRAEVAATPTYNEKKRIVLSLYLYLVDILPTVMSAISQSRLYNELRHQILIS